MRLDDLFVNCKKQADKILKEELERFNVKYEYANTTIMTDIRTVGVEGDQRTYGYPVLIELIYNKEFVWEQEEFLRRVSNRMSNEIKESCGGEEVIINRVLYFLRDK